MECDEETLNKLKKVQLLSLLEIIRICNKYHITYTPIGGTLLGTIRHKGFIPWDDDIDVGMLRTEYDRFLEVAKNELRPEFFLQTYETDPNYPKAIARLCVNNTTYLFKGLDKVNIHNGIFTDIFPYDNSPSSKLSIMSHKYLIKWLKIATYYKYNYGNLTSLKAKVGIPLLSLPFFFMNKTRVRILWENIMQKYDSNQTECVVRTGSGYPYEKVRVKQIFMEEVETMEFEGFPISVMKGYDAHLSSNYGDYMELPPIEKRRNVQAEVVEITFGPYEDNVYLEEILATYK